MVEIFDNFIMNAQKKYTPNHNINKAGIKRINTIIHKLIQKIIPEAIIILNHCKKKYMDSSDIQAVININFVGELNTKAINKAIKDMIVIGKMKKKNSKLIFPLFMKDLVELYTPDIYKGTFKVKNDTYIYLTSIIKYIIEELIDLAGFKVKKIITDKTINSIIKNDNELFKSLWYIF